MVAVRTEEVLHCFEASSAHTLLPFLGLFIEFKDSGLRRMKQLHETRISGFLATP